MKIILQGDEKRILITFALQKTSTFEIDITSKSTLTSLKPRKMRFESGKTSTRKTENLAHLPYPHAENGMRKI